MLILEKVVRGDRTEDVVFAVGRLTATPEGAKESKEGKKYLKGVSLAIDTYKNKEKKTVFYPLVFFDKEAETMAKFGEKGRLVAIYGRLKDEEYVSRDGEVKRYVFVVVERFQFCDSKKKDGSSFDHEPMPFGEEDLPF